MKMVMVVVKVMIVNGECTTIYYNYALFKRINWRKLKGRMLFDGAFNNLYVIVGAGFLA